MYFKSLLVYMSLLLIVFNSPVLPQDTDEDVPLIGDRPDLTESANTVGHLNLQIETGFGWEKFKFGKTTENSLFMPTLLRLGFGKHFELRLESALFSRLDVQVDGIQEESYSGFAPVAIGMKYNFLEGQATGDGTYGVLLMMEIPSGTDVFKTEDSTFAFKFLASWDLSDRLSLGTNLGIQNLKDDHEINYYSAMATASLGIGLTDDIGAFIELAFDSAESSEGNSAVVFDAGMTYLVMNNLQLDIALGTGLTGDYVPDFFMTSGFIVKF